MSAASQDKAWRGNPVSPIVPTPDTETITDDILRQLVITRKEDGKKAIQRRGREEWTISPVDFVYAYHFMMSLPHVSRELLGNKVRAGIITFSVPLADGNVLELTVLSSLSVIPTLAFAYRPNL